VIENLQTSLTTSYERFEIVLRIYYGFVAEEESYVHDMWLRLACEVGRSSPH